jgi:hypothetical protein
MCMKTSAVIVAAVLLLAGCGGQSAGPQGNTGAQGPQGPAGPAGPPGSPGVGPDGGATASGPLVASVTSYGAVGDCKTDDTASFQKAIDAASAPGGVGVVYIPPVAAGKCYLVKALDVTGTTGLTIEGNGPGSLVEPYGFDAAGNWWDLCDSNGLTLRDFEVTSYGTVVPNVLLFFCQKSGGQIPGGMVIDDVTIDAKSATTHFFAHNVVAGYGQALGAGGLTLENVNWIQRQAGAAEGVGQSKATGLCSYGSINFDPSQCNSVMRLDSTNSLGLSSANVTIEKGVSGTTNVLIENGNFTDYPPGYGNGTVDSNVPVQLVRVGQLDMQGGSIRTVGPVGSIMWDNSEGLVFTSVSWANSDGSGNTAWVFFGIGGGFNGTLELHTPFFSVPNVGGMFLGFGPVATGAAGAGTGGGVGALHVVDPDVGGNTNGDAFISQWFPCNASPGPWISESSIEMLPGANNIVSCGDIDATTILYDVGTVTLGAGATDSSTHSP